MVQIWQCQKIIRKNIKKLEIAKRRISRETLMEMSKKNGIPVFSGKRY